MVRCPPEDVAAPKPAGCGTAAQGVVRGQGDGAPFTSQLRTPARATAPAACRSETRDIRRRQRGTRTTLRDIAADIAAVAGGTFSPCRRPVQQHRHA